MTGSPVDSQALLRFASEVARQSGDIMRRYFHAADKQVGTKSNNTLVTIADTMINDLLIERVNAVYPAHGVLGEEASVRREAPWLWVCDPIDGTNGFISGEPTSVFSLAFVADGRPEVALILDSYQDRLYTAIRGQGAWCGDSALRVRDQAIAGAVIAGPGGFPEIDRTIRLFHDLRDSGATVRMFGGAVFKGCLLAEGRIDGLVFPGRGAHDVAAMKLLVEEAGGRVTDLLGHEQRYDRPIRGAVLSNGRIHDELLRAVRDFGAEDFLGY